jgi:uncharacterized secreted protein with C-terminal beta-propeller domain
MDEHNGFFRIATTSGNNWGEGSQTSNNIYILDETLNQVSKIENIAPGESIYAARFLGDRAYLVTFVQVDPLFTVDLSDPYNPRILGELKIPGYSEYLHPYDETHIIGIGKEVDPSIDADKVHTPGAIYYTAILGLKIALFDVSDIENPIEEAKIVIGDRGTDSPALYDHKAFLFDREKNSLSSPSAFMRFLRKSKTDMPQATALKSSSDSLLSKVLISTDLASTMALNIKDVLHTRPLKKYNNRLMSTIGIGAPQIPISPEHCSSAMLSTRFQIQW